MEPRGNIHRGTPTSPKGSNTPDPGSYPTRSASAVDVDRFRSEASRRYKVVSVVRCPVWVLLGSEFSLSLSEMENYPLTVSRKCLLGHTTVAETFVLDDLNKSVIVRPYNNISISSQRRLLNFTFNECLQSQS